MTADLAAAAQLLREETAELFARLYPSGASFAAECLHGAYALLRTVQQLEMLALPCRVTSQPFCVTSLTENFLADAGFICPQLHFSVQSPCEPLFCRADARRFLLCFSALIRNAAARGTSVCVTLRRCGSFAVLRVFSPHPAALCGGLYAAGHFARCCKGRLLEYRSAQSCGAALCLPLCAAPKAAPPAPELVRDRFSPLYTGLSPWCELPRRFALCSRL